MRSIFVTLTVCFASLAVAQEATENAIVPVERSDLKTDELTAHGNAVEYAKKRDLRSATQWGTVVAKSRRRGFSIKFETADEFASIARQCVENNAPQDAVAYADLALLASDQFLETDSPYERCKAAVIEADLALKVYKDPKRARKAFRKALALDATNSEAIEGIAKLDLDDAVTDQRVFEQQQIERDRAAGVKWR